MSTNSPTLIFMTERGRHTWAEYPNGTDQPGEGVAVHEDGRLVEATFTAYDDQNPPPSTRAGRLYQHLMREVIKPRRPWYRRLFGI